MTHVDDRPIGMFDSGIGGLTVAAAVMERLPGENLLYLGDTARVPYGTKSGPTVRRYARQIAAKLREAEVKMIVIACNTATAHALDDLKELLEPSGVPVIGVIEPGARAAYAQAQSKPIAVLATESTLASGRYQETLTSLGAPGVEGVACPLFVSLAEEGWHGDEVAVIVARRVLAPLANVELGAVLLGCTHYPLLAPAIVTALGRPDLPIVDSAHPVAEAIEETLEAHQLRNVRTTGGTLTVWVTDGAERVQRVGSRFFGHPLKRPTLVDLQP